MYLLLSVPPQIRYYLPDPEVLSVSQTMMMISQPAYQIRRDEV